jgi:CRISPR-associated protein Csb1
MSNEKVKLDQFDEWLKDDSEVAALVMRQWLEPVEGKDAVIFPPTYAKPERMKEEDWLGYNIDRFEDGTSVCQIDSVGSQANRMEPIFKRQKYRHLVPQVVIKAGEREIHLLDAGHRAADAIARFSTLGPKLYDAFRAWQVDGNAEPLARIAPTSIVFGSWDSRATQAKLPRIVRSLIRAFNVKAMHRSAQYSTIAGEILEGGEAKVATEGTEAELGLAHVPAVRTHGGVRVLEKIRREVTVNLEAIRKLAGPANGHDTLKLRRYVLGLALVSVTAPQETSLREACQLVPDPDHSFESTLVRHDGTREDFAVLHVEALAYATAAAQAFGVQQPEGPAEFKPKLAEAIKSLSKEDRKKLLRQGPVTEEAIKKFKAKLPK